jgi:hypothetical protein
MLLLGKIFGNSLKEFDNICKNFQSLEKPIFLYYLMGLNVYFGSFVEMKGAISISTILLVDVEVDSFSFYTYVPNPPGKAQYLTVRLLNPGLASQ